MRMDDIKSSQTAPPLAADDEFARFARSRRRWIWGVAGIVLLCAGVWVTWSMYASYRLNASIEAIRARGHPVFRDEFPSVSDVPADMKAAPLMRAALASVSMTSRERGIATLMQNDGISATFRERFGNDLRGFVEKNDEALGLIRQASQRPSIAWPLPEPRGPGSNSAPGDLDPEPLRHLLNSAAALALDRGDVEEALRLMRDIQFLTRALSAAPTPDAQSNITYDTVFLAGLLEDGRKKLLEEDLSPQSEAQRRELIQSLIEDLLDESDYQRGPAWELRMRSMLLAEHATAGPRFALLAPLVRLRSAYTLERHARLLDAVSAESWPEAKRILPDMSGLNPAPRVAFPQPRFEPAAFTNEVEDLVSRQFTGSARSREHLIAFHHYGLAYRRMAAIALVLTLYEHNHGRLPEQLEALVPQYLPQVPLDPFTTPPAPIRYFSGDRPLLYSVGEDGVDDMAAGRQLQSRQMSMRWTDADRILYLSSEAEQDQQPESARPEE